MGFFDDTKFSELRQQPETENQVDLGSNSTGFKHSIATKYYKTEILFVPWADSLLVLPDSLRNAVEGLVLYFDAKDRSFLDKLETYADFLEYREAEFGLLLCDHIFDEKTDGVTYREAKAHSKVLDLIELHPDSEEAGGYDEVHRAMNNTIWSNIEMNDIEGAAKREETVDGEKKEMTEQEIEEKLVDFEKLLTQAISFRANTSDMSRNERLLYAQQFADAFECIFGTESDEGE